MAKRKPKDVDKNGRPLTAAQIAFRDKNKGRSGPVKRAKGGSKTARGRASAPKKGTRQGAAGRYRDRFSTVPTHSAWYALGRRRVHAFKKRGPMKSATKDKISRAVLAWYRSAEGRAWLALRKKNKGSRIAMAISGRKYQEGTKGVRGYNKQSLLIKRIKAQGPFKKKSRKSTKSKGSSTSSTPAKKGRGRPKGSKNKAKTPAAANSNTKPKRERTAKQKANDARLRAKGRANREAKARGYTRNPNVDYDNY